MKIFNKFNRSMRDLVKYYSKILVFVISIFGLLIGMFLTNQIKRDVDYTIAETAQHIDTTMSNFKSEARRITYSTFSTVEETEDLRYYFENSLRDYNIKNILGEYVFFPKKISSLYISIDELKALSITFNTSDKFFFSTKESRLGSKVNEIPPVEDSIVIKQVLIDQVSHDVLGYVSFYFDSNIIDEKISSNRKRVQPTIIITNDTDSIIYRSNYAGNLNDKYNAEKFFSNLNLYNKDAYHKGSSALNYSLYVYFEKDVVNQEIYLTIALIFVTIAAIDLLLVYTLVGTFSSYQKQVEDIMETINEVKEGDYSHRIQLKNQGSELYNISFGINEMLNNITDYIDTIYQLEVKQRDINLMALQSQINPHFLYNTLEFIRMYAVSEGVDELAEVVYAFSELLRNNISLARETRLSDEIEFVENYIYLYQMRYPNRLAYKVSIEESLKDIMIPKFTIQPLIENYIKHGVDFKRIDNAIQINVYEDGKDVVIDISDNGRGIDEEGLVLIKKRLERDTIDIQSGSSIGLYNVHERLKAYFKDAYDIEIKSELNKGFKVAIRLDSEKRDLTSKRYKEKSDV